MQRNVEFGYQLSICSEAKENLDRVGQSQDLPVASSPALNMRASTKPCITSTEGMKACINKYAYKYTYIYD
jgi:hypothetical protein